MMKTTVAVPILPLCAWLRWLGLTLGVSVVVVVVVAAAAVVVVVAAAMVLLHGVGPV